MFLFDTLMRVSQPPWLDKYAKEVRPGLVRLRAILPDAMRIVLAHSAIYGASTLFNAGPLLFEQAQQAGLFRLPDRRVWVEFDFKDRMAAYQALGYAPMSYKEFSMIPMPAKVGYLFEHPETEPTTILVTVVWVHNPVEDIGVSLCPMAYAFDFSNNFVLPDEQMQQKRVAQLRFDRRHRKERSWMVDLLADDAELAAYVRLVPRSLFIRNPYLAEWADHISPLNEKTARTFHRAIYNDLAGEWRTILTTILLLQIENFLEFRQESRRKGALLPYVMGTVKLNRVVNRHFGEGTLQTKLTWGRLRLRFSRVWWHNSRNLAQAAQAQRETQTGAET